MSRSFVWFDGQSQLVEVDWKASSHWVWKFTDAGIEPTSEIEITIPAQIHINSVEHADNADFKIVEMDSDDESTNFSTESDPTRFYVGATCQTEKNDLVIRWHLPEKFSLLNASKQPLTDGALRISSPDPKTPIASQKVLIQHKGDQQATEYDLTFEPKIVAEKPAPPVQRKEEAKPRPAPLPTGPQFAIAIAPAYVGYPSPGNSTNNSSANNIDLSLHVEQTQTTKRSLWEAELEVPAFSIFPGPLHFPASGVYSLSGLVVVPPFTESDAKFAVLAGASLHEVHLELNSQASGFYIGPKLALSLADKTRKSLGGRAYTATIAAVALWSSGRSSFFNSYAATGSFSFELSRHFFFGKRLDLLTEASYLSLLSRDGSQVGVTNTSMGLQLWL